MLRFSLCVIATLILFSSGYAESPNESRPTLKGRWQLVSLIQDERQVPETALKGAYVDMTEELMVFHLPSKPDYPDLHLKYQFVAKGIDFRISDSREKNYDGPALYGKWSSNDRSFKFALWDTEVEQQVRPPVAPGKSVIYAELKRINDADE